MFKTATGDRPVSRLPDGNLRWPYRESQTGQWKHMDLEPFELIRRFLQHVLPHSYTRVRCFGWFHPAGKKKLNRGRALLGLKPPLTPAEQEAWQLPEGLAEPAPVEVTQTQPAPVRRCPRCGPTPSVGGRARCIRPRLRSTRECREPGRQHRVNPNLFRSPHLCLPSNLIGYVSLPSSLHSFCLFCNLPHNEPESRSADRTVCDQLPIVKDTEHAIGRRELP